MSEYLSGVLAEIEGTWATEKRKMRRSDRAHNARVWAVFSHAWILLLAVLSFEHSLWVQGAILTAAYLITLWIVGIRAGRGTRRQCPRGLEGIFDPEWDYMEWDRKKRRCLPY